MVDADDMQRMMDLVSLSLNKPKYAYEMQHNQPKPNVPSFAAVKFIDEENPGRDKVEVVEVDGKFYERITGVRLLTFKVLFTEGSPMCSQFLSTMRSARVLEFYSTRNFSYIKHKKLVNESKELETNWEIRDGLLLTYMTIRQYDTPIETIETIEWEGRYNEGDKLHTFKQLN
ncbi:tail completion [Shewanella phage SppYZU05]|uniref:Phage neck terminator protein gp12-like domain-containing protein n=1 Tax=Shewanella phage SppYZU05 TaxID=1970795 RepID=A0A1W6JTF4_9CAUD|nr:tail completion [Shewanella phage SppYZU05]ARM70540.1 hypothetical protein SppYZU05_14 [Shewanella phage SppYZU05]